MMPSNLNTIGMSNEESSQGVIEKVENDNALISESGSSNLMDQIMNQNSKGRSDSLSTQIQVVGKVAPKIQSFGEADSLK